jgi:hypothetical protein
VALENITEQIGLMRWFPVIIFGGAVFGPVLLYACKAALRAVTGSDPNTMNEQQRYVYERARAARWLYEHRFQASYINWPVLTKHNTAANSLQLPETLAQHIFTDLAYRGLLVQVVLEGGQHALTWNLGNQAAWDEVCSVPSGWKRIMLWLGENVVRLAMWLVGLIIAGIVGAYIERHVTNK